MRYKVRTDLKNENPTNVGNLHWQRTRQPANLAEGLYLVKTDSRSTIQATESRLRTQYQKIIIMIAIQKNEKKKKMCDDKMNVPDLPYGDYKITL